MGMDVYGLNPQLVGEKPVAPDWNTATEEQKDAYFKAQDDFEEANPGYYFRANVWAWRPIHVLCDLAINVAGAPLSTEGWGNNSGNGLDTQLKCDILADALDLFLILNNANAKDDDDSVYICFGMWVYGNGQFVNEDKSKKLNEEHPVGTIMYNGVVDEDGQLVFPSHGVSLGHVRTFIKFLRHCGGFEIC